jgi:predicted transposase/invertase (TIGR01784 family)
MDTLPLGLIIRQPRHRVNDKPLAQAGAVGATWRQPFPATRPPRYNRGTTNPTAEAPMIPGIDPKIDYAFKRIFGQERNRAVLIHLLNAVLHRTSRSPVTDLELINPFNDKETIRDKLSVVDVRARDQFGRQFNVEMQMLTRNTLPDRVLYYWSRPHSRQLLEGQDYDCLQDTINICFLNEVQFPALPEFHLCFQLREERHPEVVFSPQIEIHLFELPKFLLPAEGLHTPLEQGFYFLKHGEGLDPEVLPATLQVPEIRQALGELIMVTQSEHDWARYEERYKAEMDARSRDKDMLETGRRQALQQLTQELVRQVHRCQRLLKQPQTPQGELAALPEVELRRLLENLEQQVDSSFPPPTGSS